MLVCSLPVKNRNGWLVTYLVFLHTFQPCSWCHWHRLLGTKWWHSWSHFLWCFNIDFKQRGPVSVIKCKNCRVSVCHSIPFNKALAASLLCFSFNLSPFCFFQCCGPQLWLSAVQHHRLSGLWLLQCWHVLGVRGQGQSRSPGVASWISHFF